MQVISALVTLRAPRLALLSLALALLVVDSISSAPTPLGHESSSPAQQSPFITFPQQRQQQQQQQQQQRQQPLQQQQQQSQQIRRSGSPEGARYAPRQQFIGAPAVMASPRWAVKPSAQRVDPGSKPHELRAIRVGNTPPAVPEDTNHVHLDGQPIKSAELAAAAVPAKARTAQDAFALARDFMTGLQGGSGTGGQAPQSSFNLNNQQATIKVGNSKEVNVNTINSKVAPTVTNSHLGKLDLSGAPSLLNPAKNAPASGKVQGGIIDGPSASLGLHVPAAVPLPIPESETKTKATSEQKELKKKLLELADKATSLPVSENADLLKFNAETEQFEPVAVDPNAALYKQKLQDAIKALSAKKLPTERLKEALDGLDSSRPSSSAFLRPPSGLSGVGEHQAFSGQGSFLGLPQSIAAAAQSASDNNDGLIEIEQPQEYEAEQFPAERYEDEDWEEQEEEVPLAGGEELLQPEEEELQQPEEKYYFEGEPEAAYESHPIEDDGEPEEALEIDPLMQMREILADRLNRISDLLYFRPEFLNQLLQIDDNLLTPIEAEFKRMILCNSDEQFCQDDLSKYVHPDGLLPPPLNEEDLLPPGEQLQRPPAFGAGPYERADDDDDENEMMVLPYEEVEDAGGLLPPSPSPVPVTPGFVPRHRLSLPFSSPAGAKKARSFSKTSVNYQFDHAHANEHYGEEGAAPVVQHVVAKAKSWIDGRPLVDMRHQVVSRPAATNKQRDQHTRQPPPLGVRSTGPATSTTTNKRRRFDEPQAHVSPPRPAENSNLGQYQYGQYQQQQRPTIARNQQHQSTTNSFRPEPKVSAAKSNPFVEAQSRRQPDHYQYHHQQQQQPQPQQYFAQPQSQKAPQQSSRAGVPNIQRVQSERPAAAAAQYQQAQRQAAQQQQQQQQVSYNPMTGNARQYQQQQQQRSSSGPEYRSQVQPRQRLAIAPQAQANH